MISCCLGKQNFQKRMKTACVLLASCNRIYVMLCRNRRQYFFSGKRASRHLATLLTLKTILSSPLAPSRHKRSSQKQQGEKREKERGRRRGGGGERQTFSAPPSYSSFPYIERRRTTRPWKPGIWHEKIAVFYFFGENVEYIVLWPDIKLTLFFPKYFSVACLNLVFEPLVKINWTNINFSPSLCAVQQWENKCCWISRISQDQRRVTMAPPPPPPPFRFPTWNWGGGEGNRCRTLIRT